MIIVPNHHVIVPRTADESAYLPYSVTDDRSKRQAKIIRKYMDNDDTILLDFVPLSDLWIEIYLEGHRIVNPHYLIKRTHAWAYEVFNVRENEIFFTHPITGNVKVIVDTLTHTDAETLKIPGISGLYIDFQNLQSYDIYENIFVPTRHSKNYYNWPVTQVKLRVGDALYAEPLVLCEPCYGYVRVSKNRKDLVYVPRKNFKGYDVFTYTLMTQHGQMGQPAGFTVKVVEDDSPYRYNFSGDFSGDETYLKLPDRHNVHLSAIAGKKLTVEFFFYTRAITNKSNYRVGLFGQHMAVSATHAGAAPWGRWSIYLQGYAITGTQQLVFRYGTYKQDNMGNYYHDVHRISSRLRLKQNQWHFVSVSIDASLPTSGVIYFFIDGNLEVFEEQDLSAQHSGSGLPFYVGSIFGCESQHFNGYISNFRITIGYLINIGIDDQVPIRPLANVSGANILTLTNNIESVHSVMNWVGNTTIPKNGNIVTVDFGPFSPSILNVDKFETIFGETLNFTIDNDFICQGTFVPWTIKTLGDRSLIANVSNFSGALGMEFTYIDSTNSIVYPNSWSLQNLRGNFIVDEIDQVKVSITNSNLLMNKTKYKFYLDNYPNMYKIFTVYADPGSCVLDLNTANISSYLGYVHDLINYNHGSLINDAVYSTMYSGIYTFNGIDNFIQGHTSLAVDQCGDMTCEIWFRIAASTSGNVRVFGKGNVSYLTYEISYNTSSNAIFYKRTSDHDIAFVKHILPHSMIGQWLYVTATSENYDHKLYVNGILVAKNGNDFLPFRSSRQGYTIGHDGSGGFHNGDFGHCRLYRRALSNSEVLSNFTSTKFRFGLS